MGHSYRVVLTQQRSKDWMHYKAIQALRVILAEQEATPASPSNETREDREPLPTDGPDYHADHAAWARRQHPSNQPEGAA